MQLHDGLERAPEMLAMGSSVHVAALEHMPMEVPFASTNVASEQRGSIDGDATFGRRVASEASEHSEGSSTCRSRICSRTGESTAKSGEVHASEVGRTWSCVIASLVVEPLM